MKIEKRLIIVLFFIGICLLFNNTSYAGTQKLNSLDFDVQLNNDGSMDVVETWDIYVSETNTLFKDFDLDSSKYSGITNVQVMDMDTETQLTQIYEEMYHVTKNCYYGLPISGNMFEIAWGVGLDDSSATKTYRISYTVEDAIAVYEDCSELYWQFIGTNNGIPVKEVTGIITLPQEVSNIENLKVWAHGPLNGEIERGYKDIVAFHLKNLDTRTMLEVRVAIKDDMFYSGRQYNTYKLADIMEEEQMWADEANAEREYARNSLIMIMLICVLILLFFVFKMLKYRRILKKIKNEKFHVEEIKYFRDIPRENEATPAEAAFLYNPIKNVSVSNLDEQKVFSATLLQLCLKKYITFEKKDDKHITIRVLKSNDEGLKQSEKIVWSIINKVKPEGTDEVTMDAITAYAGKKYDDFYELMKKLKEAPKNYYTEIGYYDKDKEKQVKKYQSKTIIYLALIMLSIMFLPVCEFNGLSMVAAIIPVTIGCIGCIIFLSKITREIGLLSEQGEIEKEQWKGLKRYMEDFSLLKERDVPDLVLWEKYLVYATVFGISKKVIEQLMLIYGDFQNDDRLTYLYFMDNRHFGTNFVDVFEKETGSIYRNYERAYSAAHSTSSSGGGSGGGFSGGGGGRWWRRPEWAEDKIYKKYWKNF